MTDHPWKGPAGFGTAGGPPCGKNCEDRAVGCQSRCEKYLEWKARREEYARKRIGYLTEQKDANEFQRKCVNRAIKKKQKDKH